MSQKNWDRLFRKRHAEMMEYMRKNPHGIFVDHGKSIRGVMASFPLKEGRDAIREVALEIEPEWPAYDRARRG